MNRTISSAVALKSLYGEVGESSITIDKQCNLYGFVADANGQESDVFIKLFDDTILVAIYRIPADSMFGRDPMSIPIHHFNKSLVMKATTTRDGEVAPENPIYINLWYWDVL